jgi:hypothetical protein
MPSRSAIAALFACVLAAGCSGEHEESLFSASDATETARRYHDALTRGDAAAAVALSRVPFRYKDVDRVWRDQAALRKNLAKEIPRIQHLLGGLGEVEVFSRHDLLDGKWPREREVPEDRREAEIAALGVETNGWVARVYSASKPGYLLVLNPEGFSHLAVQMIDI